MKHEQLEAIRKNSEEASGLPFTAFSVSQSLEKDIPALLAEVEEQRETIEVLREDLSECERHLEGISEQSERFYEKYRKVKQEKARSESKLKSEIERLKLQLNGGDSV